MSKGTYLEKRNELNVRTSITKYHIPNWKPVAQLKTFPNKWFAKFILVNILYTMSWGCWKHVFWIPGARPMFLKAELHKESKNGFKTINFRPPSVMIFSKNWFRSKKNHQKNGCFVDFWIFTAIYMNNLDQF